MCFLLGCGDDDDDDDDEGDGGDEEGLPDSYDDAVYAKAIMSGHTVAGVTVALCWRCCHQHPARDKLTKAEATA